MDISLLAALAAGFRIYIVMVVFAAAACEDPDTHSLLKSSFLQSSFNANVYGKKRLETRMSSSTAEKGREGRRNKHSKGREATFNVSLPPDVHYQEERWELKYGKVWEQGTSAPKPMTGSIPYSLP